MAKHFDLLASYWTLSGTAQPHTDREWSEFQFKDRVAAAARAGFTGMGIWHADLEHSLQKHSLREMKQILDDHGIVHIELEFLGDFFLDGEKKFQSDITKKMLLEAAEAFEAHHVKVGSFEHTDAPMSKVIDAFGELCREGAEHDARIGWELMPFCDIDSVEKAVELVKGAGESNGGICLDLWHLAKLRIPYEKVARMPLKYITSIEVNDGTRECPWPLHEDTVNHRVFCGEGEFDPKRFVSVMLKAGYDGPWGIEVLNLAARSWPLAKLASHAFKTTIAQFPGQRRQERPRKSSVAHTKKAKYTAKPKARKSKASKRATRRKSPARDRRR
ncbi:MAG: sugar phosphate isomerase/epimerase family protein [Candidatus Acidiferrales bacterium]